MKRRSFLVAASTLGFWAWSPRLAISEITSDARNYVVRARKVIVDNFGLQTIANSSHKFDYRIEGAHREMSKNSYTDTKSPECNLSMNNSRKIGILGARKADSFCAAYIDPSSQDGAIAYLADIGFFMHAYSVELTSGSWSKDQIIDYLAPKAKVADFRTKWDSDRKRSLHIHSLRGVLAIDYEYSEDGAGTAALSLIDKVSSNYLFQRTVDFHFQV